MDTSNLNKILAAEPKYRYIQINKALFRDYISSWDEASNLPKALREKLAAECPLEIKAEIFKTGSGRHSEKALITLEDREAIETVLIRQRGAPVASNKIIANNKGGKMNDNKTIGRNTVCISSQAGCPLGCAFCATGAGGFRRNLTAEEIIDQVVFWARYLKRENQMTAAAKVFRNRGVTSAAPEKIDNIVFMGMGEPFLNYNEFIKAAKFLNDPEKFNIGARRISVSTIGITEGIKRLAGEKLQINLAISLHAPDDHLRRELIPVAKKYSLREIFKAVDNYITKTGRRVMFEYLMIKGVNDRDEDALALAKLMKKPLYMVNLIPYNPTGRFESSTRERIDDFKKILEDNNIPATVRLSFGASIGAACGQLRGKKK